MLEIRRGLEFHQENPEETLASEPEHKKEDEVFHPEIEVREILDRPTSERPKKLAEYKRKLAEQKEGLAQVQESVIEFIRKNPEASFETLYNMATTLGERFGMADYQKGIVDEVLLRYSQRHLTIQELRKLHSDDSDLFFAVFGVKPKGKIEAIAGLVTLYFRCENLDDYTLIHSQAFLKDKKIIPKQKIAARKSGGVSLSASLVPGLEGGITAEKSGYLGYKFGGVLGNTKRVFEHEEQHAIKNLFRETTQKKDQSIAWDRVNYASESEFETTLKTFLRIRRENAEESAKDEIMAFAKNGLNPEQIVAILTKPNYLYNYLDKDSLYLKDFFGENFKPQFYPIAIKLVDKIFVEEYKKLLAQATGSFSEIIKKGYSVEGAISLLIHEPLSKWGKIVDRIMGRR